MRKARAVRRMIILALAAALGVCGCVAVPPRHTDRAPEPPSRLAPAEVRPPAPAVPVLTPPPAREELASTDPLPRAKKRSAHPKPPTWPEPPADRRADARRRPQHQEPDRAPAHRAAQPTKKPKAPRRPKAGYDMRFLCARANGVVPPGVADLCRSTYGR